MNSDLTNIHIGDTVAVDSFAGWHSATVIAETPKQITAGHGHFWRKSGKRVGDRAPGNYYYATAYILDAETQALVDTQRRDEQRAEDIKTIRRMAQTLTDAQIARVLAIIEEVGYEC
jgi:hypothetical protein